MRGGESELVGRQRELSILANALSSVGAGLSQIALVAEPGIGKSCLAQAFVDKVGADGDLAAWANCWEWGGAPPFWPWTQILKKLLAVPGAKAELPDAERQQLAELVPELRDTATDEHRPPQPSSEQARFELFQAVTSVLRRAASRCRVVIVLDDLHAADESSLRLLHFASRELYDVPLMLLGTLRNAGTRPRRDSETNALLDTIMAKFAEIPLSALSEADVAQLIERAAGEAPHPSLVSELYQRTAGNSLFLDRMIHAMVARGDTASLKADDLEIPDSLRSAIRSRLAPLDLQARQVLVASAVLGRPASTMELCALVSMPAPKVLQAIRVAADAGFLAFARDSQDRYTLRHAVVREVLTKDMEPAERMAMHATIADTLSLHEENLEEVHLVEVAYHYRQAAVLDEELRDKAIDYTMRAGQIFMAQLAFENAAVQYQRALSLLPPREEVRFEVMLALADALVAAAKPSEARDVYAQVAHRAREANQILPFSRAAYGFAKTGEYGAHDKEKLALLQEALERTPADNHAMRSEALGRLAAELWAVPDAIERRNELSKEALREARVSGETAIIAAALKARLNATMGPDGLAERRVLSNQLSEVAREIDDTEMLLEGHRWNLNALLALGQLEEVPQAIADYAQVASSLRRPQLHYNVALRDCVLPLLRGDFETARERIDQALAAGADAGDVHAGAAWCSGRVALAFATGRFDDAEELITQLDEHAERLKNLAMYQAQPLAIRLVRNMDLEGVPALTRLDAMADRELPQNFITLATVSVSAYVCVYRDDKALAARLLDRYRNFSEYNACVGAYLTYGSFARYLGMLAAVVGDREQAIEFYETALVVNTRIGAKPWLVWTLRELAGLLRSGGAEHHARCKELSNQAEDLASKLKMGSSGSTLVLKASAAVEVEVETEVAAPLSHPAQVAALLREHDYWSLRYGESVHRLKHQRGFEYLVVLLSQPREELHALDIAGGQHVDGDLGEVLDEKAMSTYRTRVDALRSTIEKARESGEGARGESAERELELLTRELASATGLGGRSRSRGSSSERARSSVTRALRRAIDSIRAAEPQLASDLDACVRTGTYCRYQPMEDATLTWRF